MQPVKLLCALALLFTACRATRQTASLPATEAPQTIAYAASPDIATPAPQQLYGEELPAVIPEETAVEDTVAADAFPATSLSSQKASTKKAHSFAQLKEMARSGEITMSKRDMRTLNKLDKKFKGDFRQYRSDAFEFTDKAKIIAGVGILGLLLAIFVGSWFGAFLFILAALAFILRYFDVIAF